MPGASAARNKSDRELLLDRVERVPVPRYWNAFDVVRADDPEDGVPRPRRQAHNFVPKIMCDDNYWDDERTAFRGGGVPSRR